MPSLIVFGDSLCDGGNAYALRGDAAFPCPPHWQGRRCDGPVWVEQLAARLGLPPLVHSLAGGTNQAFGGARSGAGLSPKGMPNLLEQVAGFLGKAEVRNGVPECGGVGPGPGPRPGGGILGGPAPLASATDPEGTPPRSGGLEPGIWPVVGDPGPAASLPARRGANRISPPAGQAASLEPAGLGDRCTPPDPEALVVLRAGANDYLDAPPSPAVGDAVNRHLLGAVERLAAAGFRRFLVPSELPWGFSPIQLPGLGEAERRGLNALIARQNALLQEALAELAGRRDLVVVQPDFQALFLAVRAEPAAYGFTEVGRPVLELEREAAGPAADSPPSALGAAPARTPADAWSSPRDPGLHALGESPAGAGFLWWDSWAHLTTAFHALLAAAALNSL